MFLLLSNFFTYVSSFVLQVLLGSELIKSSSEERSLLKNLGSWLGKLTIGRNHVLRAREIDPKSLIVEVFSPISSKFIPFFGNNCVTLLFFSICRHMKKG